MALTLQNADPDKEIVALGQTYFAVQMRRQEVAETELLASLNDDQRRLYRVCTNENDLFTEKTVESGRLSEVVGPN